MVIQPEAFEEQTRFFFSFIDTVVIIKAESFGINTKRKKGVVSKGGRVLAK